MQDIIEALSDRNLAEVARRLRVTRAYLSAVANERRTPGAALTERLRDYLGLPQQGARDGSD